MSGIENTVITHILLAMLMTTDKILSEVARKVIWVMLVVRVSVLVGQVGGFLGLRGRYITPSTGPSFNDLFALQKCVNVLELKHLEGGSTLFIKLLKIHSLKTMTYN